MILDNFKAVNPILKVLYVTVASANIDTYNTPVIAAIVQFFSSDDLFQRI